MNTTTVKNRVREPEMAERLSTPERTLRKWRFQRLVPYEKIGRVVLYDPEAVLRALQKFERAAK